MNALARIRRWIGEYRMYSKGKFPEIKGPRPRLMSREAMEKLRQMCQESDNGGDG